MDTSDHTTVSMLGCFEISSAKAINSKLFTLASGRFLDKGKISHILHQTITRTVFRPHIKIHLLLSQTPTVEITSAPLSSMLPLV